MTAPYPHEAAERSAWIVARRGPRATLDPWRPHAFFVEDERMDSAEIVKVATIFLTNRECPWRCLMCDLWRNTLPDPVPPGAIPAQIEYALERLPAVQAVKLYNSGSFFDRHAIPRSDHETIAAQLQSFARVIVECHPALVGRSAADFGERLSGRLEVAMGLETVHPEILPKLNKQMTLQQFADAAAFLSEHAIALRAFILVKPPFLDEAGALFWAQRSLEFAFDCRATAATLIPTRPGNGALETLAARGEFAPPRLATLETAAANGLALQRGRVFSDLWDLERFSDCPHCYPARAARLREMNLRQVAGAPVACDTCGGR